MKVTKHINLNDMDFHQGRKRVIFNIFFLFMFNKLSDSVSENKYDQKNYVKTNIHRTDPNVRDIRLLKYSIHKIF